jgi:hypothetical protein
VKEKAMDNLWKLAAVLLFSLSIAGCSKLLPSSKVMVDSPWDDYNSAKQAYEKITPNITNIDDLKNLNFDPYIMPNIRIMNVTEIITTFTPNPSIKLDDLDSGIQECIKKRERCIGYKIEPTIRKSKRVGNFWADLFTFKRHTVNTGWEFSGLITIVDGVVTYKDPVGGTPLIKSEETVIKPLGPLQEAADFIFEESVRRW